jgi:Tfp pilus assembly PilM family ATPase/Tfp pilus assembly protein PilN
MSSKTPAPKSVCIAEAGAGWFKFVQAEPARRAVTRVLVEPMNGEDPESVAALAAFIKRQKLTGRSVIACLPRQWVNVRMMELPSTEPSEIADMVELQIGKQTPYSRDEIVVDYRILGSQRDGYSKIMLVIVQKGVLRHRFHMLEEAGFDVDRMAISTEGLVNWACLNSGSGEASVILDVDTVCTDFTVVDAGGLVFSRSIRIGSEQLSAGAADGLESLIQECRRSLEACQSEAPDLAVSRLVLTGAGPSLPGIADSLSQALNLPVEAVDSLSVAKKAPSEVQAAGGDAPPALTPLVGMALAPQGLSVGLVPDSVKLRRSLLLRARSLTALGIAVMTALVCASFFGVNKIYLRKGQLDRMLGQIRETGPVVAAVEQQLQVMKVVQKRQETRSSAVNLWAEVQKAVPDDIFLDGLDFDVEEGRLMLSGTAGQRGDVSALVKNIEKSPFFANVKTDGSIDRVAETGRYKFRIVGDLEAKE